MQDHDISQRRACRLVGVDPKTVRRDRPSRRPAGEWNIRREGDNADVREAMKEIAGKRRWFGYRWIGVLLERKGYVMNHKKLYRLYCEEGLAVKRRRGRKRARGSRTPMPVALRPNDRPLSANVPFACRATGRWTSCQTRSARLVGAASSR